MTRQKGKLRGRRTGGVGSSLMSAKIAGEGWTTRSSESLRGKTLRSRLGRIAKGTGYHRKMSGEQEVLEERLSEERAGFCGSLAREEKVWRGEERKGRQGRDQAVFWF